MYDENERLHQMMLKAECGYLSDLTPFKEYVKERFVNMAQNCNIYYSNGDMYVQVDETIYRKISHEILRKFENISYVYVHYQLIETYPDEVPYAVLEDTLICQEIKEVVIAMYQLVQYEQMFWLYSKNVHPDIEFMMPPVTVKIHYTNGEARLYPDMRLFNQEFFKDSWEDDVNGFIQV